jgi:hypothetical protein
MEGTRNGERSTRGDGRRNEVAEAGSEGGDGGRVDTVEEEPALERGNGEGWKREKCDQAEDGERKVPLLERVLGRVDVVAAGDPC